MRNIRPDRTVVVNVRELLSKMRDNREEHQRIYLEALEGYKHKCISMLESRLKEAKSTDGIVSMGFRIEKPVSYVEQYDTVIEMLEWTTEATIEVTMEEFNAWVRDRWDWQRGFLTSNSLYSSSATLKMQDLM